MEKRSRKNFTDQEDQFIRENYMRMQFSEIAQHLGRKTGSINHRVRNLGLSKKSLRRWGADDDAALIQHLDSGLEAVSKLLNRHPNEVSTRAAKLGCPFSQRELRREKDGYKYSVHTDVNGRRVWIWEHVRVMENHLGRKIIRPEQVHHINGLKHDNRVENLFLCRDKSHHFLVHRSLDRLLPQLIERGFVRFNREAGIYEINDGDTE